MLIPFTLFSRDWIERRDTLSLLLNESLVRRAGRQARLAGEV